MKVKEMIHPMFAHLEEIRAYAEKHRVPIIAEESIEWLGHFLEHKNIDQILEVGGAIGYSSLCFSAIHPNATVLSIERDDERYSLATDNLKQYDVDQSITFIHGDAQSDDFFQKVQDGAPYDLVFIDATKRENQLFFEKFAPLVRPGGIIITDNLNFHGLTELTDLKEIPRRIRPMIRAIKEYRTWVMEVPGFETTIVEVGDTISISVKK